MADMVKDEDFEAFCAALKSERTDISVIIAGIEKYGFKYLSDSQKAMVQDALFPKPSADKKEERGQLGFQNLKRISKYMKAMQKLHSEGKIGKEEIISFMTEPHLVKTQDANGKETFTEHKNAMSIIALNTYAFEFKDKKFKAMSPKPEGAIRKLHRHSKTLAEIQETLNQFDADILHKTFNTIDKNTSGRDLRYSDLARKSARMKKALKKAERYGANHSTEIRQVTPKTRSMVLSPRSKANTMLAVQQNDNEQEEPTRIGGMQEPLNISGENKDKLNFSAGENPQEQNTQETTENTAQMEPPQRDSEKGKHEPFNFTPVKPQDLISYLYEAWFLGFVNYVLQKVFNGLDALGDYLAGDRGQVPVRTSAVAKATGKDKPENDKLTLPAQSKSTKILAKAISGQTSLLADAVKKSYVKDFKYLINKPDLLSSMMNCVRNNLGREPEKWGRAFVADENGETKVAFDPHAHKDFAERMNEAFGRDKESFNERMGELSENPQVLKKVFSPDMIQICAHLSAIDYLRSNKEGDPIKRVKASDAIHKETLVKMFEILETLEIIYKQKEAEYRVKHNLDPDGKLTSRQLKHIYEDTGDEFKGYMTDIVCEGKKLKEAQCAYQAEKDSALREKIKRVMDKQETEFDRFYDHYRTQSEDTRKPRIYAETAKQDIREAAAEANQGERKEAAFNQDLDNKQAAHEAKVKGNEARKNNFERGKRKIFNKQNTQTQSKPFVKGNRVHD